MDNSFCDLSSLSVKDILTLINDEDKKVASVVTEALDDIKVVVDYFIEVFNHGGEIHFAGAGTSGRMGASEVAEVPPTFGVPLQRINLLLAGGEAALHSPQESAEDDERTGRNLVRSKVSEGDLVIGISASGETPFTLGCIREAKNISAKTIGIVNTAGSTLERIADTSVAVEVGSEVIRGSTRMKAGTAQKMILNMITTTAMVKTGHTYGNLMIGMKANNKKLRKRAEDILQTITGESAETIKRTLNESDYELETALTMIEESCSYDRAKRIIESSSEESQDQL